MQFSSNFKVMLLTLNSFHQLGGAGTLRSDPQYSNVGDVGLDDVLFCQNRRLTIDER